MEGFKELEDAWEQPTCKHLERRYKIVLESAAFEDDSSMYYSGAEVIRFPIGLVKIGDVQTVMRIIVKNPNAIDPNQIGLELGERNAVCKYDGEYFALKPVDPIGWIATRRLKSTEVIEDYI